MLVRVLVQETITVQKVVTVEVKKRAESDEIEEMARERALEGPLPTDGTEWELVSSEGIDCTILND